MKYICTILLILQAFAGTAQHEPDCKSFRNGKFKIIDQNAGNSIIERNGSRQIEYTEDGRLRLEFRVRWLNDCEYTLKLRKILDNPDRIKFSRKMIIHVKIIETRENAYLQRSSSNLSDLKVEALMHRID